MNKYDEIYDIRFATLEDVEDIMQFIREEWSENHILGNSREFFMYEHKIGDEITFIIAKNKNDNKIYSLLGYIYASDDKDCKDIWTGIWRTKDGAMSLLGLELMKRARGMLNARSLSGIGDNPNTTIRLMKAFMKHFTGKLNHYYMLSDCLPFKIAKVNEPIGKNIANPGNHNVYRVTGTQEISDFLNNLDKRSVPYKNAWYLNHKYFNNPIFDYGVFAIDEDKTVHGLVIFREQCCNSSKVLRVIDYIGEQQYFPKLKAFLNEKLKEYEYIDFYTLGFEEQYILDAGFRKRDENDTNIIPNYFYPFEQRNIDIWVDSSYPTTVFMKGDGDQDRPNGLEQ